MSIGNYRDDPLKLIGHLWYTTLLFAFIFFIGCVAVASENNISPYGNKAAGFVAVWSMFVILLSSIYGTLTLNVWQDYFSLGVFLGLVTMLVQFELILFAIFASLSLQSKLDADGLVAAFSFFLFLLYLAFGLILVRNREKVIKMSPPTGLHEPLSAAGDSVSEKDVHLVVADQNVVV